MREPYILIFGTNQGQIRAIIDLSDESEEPLDLIVGGSGWDSITDVELKREILGKARDYAASINRSLEGVEISAGRMKYNPRTTKMRPSTAEIEKQIGEADSIEADEGNSGCFGETYEAGVSSALQWAIGLSPSKPIEIEIETK